MIVTSPPPNTHNLSSVQPHHQHQWEALHFKQVEVHVDNTRKPRRPRRSSLTVPTQKESLTRHFVSKRRRLVSTMHVVVALLDLLNKVREKRAKEEASSEAPTVATTTTSSTDSETFNYSSELESVVRRISTMSMEESTTFSSQKHLDFSYIEVRVYEQILEVNPGSRRGPAIGIGWRYLQSDPIAVDEYEKIRPPRKIVGKDYRPLTEKQRVEILKSQGYSKHDLEEAVRVTDEARQLRRKTIDDLKRHRGEDTCAEKREEAALRLQRLTFMRRSSEDEIRQLWKEANSPDKPKKKLFSMDSFKKQDGVSHDNGSKSGKTHHEKHSLLKSFDSFKFRK